MKSGCRSRKQKRKNQPIAKPGIDHCHWFILPFLLTTPKRNFSLYHKQRSHKQNRCFASNSVGLIFTRLYRSTLLNTTPTSESQPLNSFNYSGSKMSPPSQCCAETLQLKIFEQARLLSFCRFLAARHTRLNYLIWYQHAIYFKKRAKASHEPELLRNKKTRKLQSNPSVWKILELLALWSMMKKQNLANWRPILKICSWFA